MVRNAQDIIITIWKDSFVANTTSLIGNGEFMNTPSTNEIERLLRDCVDSSGSRFPGMTFEQGFEEALRWVLGEIPTDELSILDPSGE